MLDMSVDTLLRHQKPMILLDRVLEKMENGACCEVDISPTCLFADAKGVPAYVSIEFMAQTIGIYDGLECRMRNQEPEIGFLIGTKQLELNCDYFVFGQTLRTEALLLWDGGKLVQFECAVYDAQSNKKLASATVSIYSPAREETE